MGLEFLTQGECSDTAPGSSSQIISEEQSLGMFYSHQNPSYLTCVMVFTQSLQKPPAIHLTGCSAQHKFWKDVKDGGEKKKKKHHTRTRVPFLIHNAIHSVNTCQLTDFLFPIAYEKIMAVGLRVNSPININSPWSSWNISSMPVFQHKLTPFLSPNDALQQGEKETAHLYILFMLIKWSLIHTRHLNWH